MNARFIVTMFVALAMASTSNSVDPNEILEDPALEQRARALSQDLRCLVCQNQSIDDSNADLARDLRVVVRERLTEGDTDKQVTAFIVARYGEFVLLRPPMNARTSLLWSGPGLLLLFGAIGLVLWFRRRSTAAEEGLSADEEKRLAALTNVTKVSGETDR